jgi:hypothetical protein
MTASAATFNVVPMAAPARPDTLVYSTTTGCAPVAMVSEYVADPRDVAVDVEAAYLMRRYGADTRYTLYVQSSKYVEGAEIPGATAREVASYWVDSAYYREVSYVPEVADLRLYFPPVAWAA